VLKLNFTSYSLTCVPVPLLRHRFPWDICFLLGGGFAISLGFKDSGLSIWIADRLQGITDLPPVAIVALLCAGTAAFTEFNSNVASASILLPLVGRLAVTSGQNPLLFMMPVTLATSFAFCLPIATAPNAIAFGTGCMTVADMIKVCCPLPQQRAVLDV
jgi:solute carrier family 13 (sodium-dependent dicarboxylate transporter), member 2/3/5